ncbi:MAG: large subunit ribosomal protein [Solirubrobacterales bacterium]|jgi:large subunit ribosomal protein L10|nr:large subunit ribosomal protein [Solirubrobacterales bacterium]
MNRDQKAAVVEDLASEIKGAGAIFAVDYRGISVPQAAELRSKLREVDATFRVVKNRLTLRAVDQAGVEELKQVLEGPTAFTFVRGDAVVAAKTLAEFRKEHEILEYKGGLMDGTAVDSDQFTAIARLPGRDILNGQLAGMVASPITGLVRGLGALISGLAIGLKQIHDQGLVSGETPPQETSSEQDESDQDESETSDDDKED